MKLDCEQLTAKTQKQQKATNCMDCHLDDDRIYKRGEKARCGEVQGVVSVISRGVVSIPSARFFFSKKSGDNISIIMRGMNMVTIRLYECRNVFSRPLKRSWGSSLKAKPTLIPIYPQSVCLSVITKTETRTTVVRSTSKNPRILSGGGVLRWWQRNELVPRVVGSSSWRIKIIHAQ